MLVSHSFDNNAALSLAPLVRPYDTRGALTPLPVAAEEGAHKPRNTPLLVALHDCVELLFVLSA